VEDVLVEKSDALPAMKAAMTNSEAALETEDAEVGSKLQIA